MVFAFDNTSGHASCKAKDALVELSESPVGQQSTFNASRKTVQWGDRGRKIKSMD